MDDKTIDQMTEKEKDKYIEGLMGSLARSRSIAKRWQQAQDRKDSFFDLELMREDLEKIRKGKAGRERILMKARVNPMTKDEWIAATKAAQDGRPLPPRKDKEDYPVVEYLEQSIRRQDKPREKTDRLRARKNPR